jgi:hypothetical protein
MFEPVCLSRSLNVLLLVSCHASILCCVLRLLASVILLMKLVLQQGSRRLLSAACSDAIGGVLASSSPLRSLSKFPRLAPSFSQR